MWKGVKGYNVQYSCGGLAWEAKRKNQMELDLLMIREPDVYQKLMMIQEARREAFWKEFWRTFRLIFAILFLTGAICFALAVGLLIYGGLI